MKIKPYRRELALPKPIRPSFRRPLRPRLEWLEERALLAVNITANGTLPDAIVVGRTLSVPQSNQAGTNATPPSPSYFVSEVVNNQVTITYSVYNEQANDETGVLLTDNLQPGITVASASQAFDQSGQSLVFSLGTIPGFNRASVSITLNLPKSTPTQLDDGARVYATLNANAVSNSTPAAVLSTGTVDATLLASTPDANTNDPYIQEQAAKLKYDPTQIFNFLHTQVGYNSYYGSMRGARGTLWSAAGNALDVASLGVALMRASGIPAQYVAGTLSSTQAQGLVASMFAPSLQSAGYISSGTQTSNPIFNFQLTSEAASHYWFQFNAGSGMKDADPLISGASIGQVFTTSTSTFAQVADALRDKVVIKLNAETYTQASALFGAGSGLSTNTVLTQTFNDVDLVGRPLTIGNLVSSNGIGAAVFSVSTTTYTPYIIVGGDGFDPSGDQIILGQAYQQTVTNFPLGNQLVTGLFLEVDETDSNGAANTFNRTLADAIGTAARLGGGGSASVDPNGPPLISPLDLWTLDLNSGQFNPNAFNGGLAQIAALQSGFTTFTSQLSTTPPGATDDALGTQATTALRNALVTMSRSRLDQFDITSDSYTQSMAQELLVKAYFDSPKIVVLSTRATLEKDGSVQLGVSIDLLKDSMRVIASAATAAGATIGFEFNRGLMENVIEAAAIGNPPGGNASSPISAPLGTAAIFQAAVQQGISFVTLLPSNAQGLDAINIPADAKALITQALANGDIVIVPSSAVTVNGQQSTGWYQLDTSTGEITGVLEDGQHGGIGEFAANQLLNPTSQTNIFSEGVIAGLTAGSLAKLAVFLYKIALQAAVNSVDDPGLSTLANVKQLLSLFYQGLTRSIEAALIGKPPLFVAGFAVGFTASLLFAADPPIGSFLIDPTARLIKSTPNSSQINTSIAASKTPGAAQGSVATSNLSVNGQIAASWSSSARSGFDATTISASNATIQDSTGKTVGTGSVSLAGTSLVALGISGNNQYNVNGSGSLSFYSAAESALGVSGDWAFYSATITGGLAISLATGQLTLNGISLPVGTYTILAASATIAGSGPSTTPSFSGSTSLTVNHGTVSVGPGTGSPTVGGKPLDSKNGFTFTGYSGTLNVAAGSGDADTIVIAGSAENVLSVSSSPSTFSTDQNTPISFTPSVQSSLGDTYTLTALAPNGWTVAIDASGKVTVTPAPGVQSGTFAISVVAQSATNPNLVAQTIVNVTIGATQPGLNFGVAPDPILTVPFNGANVPSAFLASIQNLGPASDTYNLAFSNLPGSFTLLNSGTSVTVPAGATGVLGLYLQPISGQPLPAPETVVSFTVTATSTTNNQLTKSQTVTLTVPTIEGVTLTADPVIVNTLPGTAVTQKIILTNVGNIAETGIKLTTSNIASLTVGPIASIDLAVGESKTIEITLTPGASVPLNSELSTTLTATFGLLKTTQTLPLDVAVVAPGVTAIANAAAAATELSDTNLADRLHDLSVALTNLAQTPLNPVYKGQVLANIDSIVSLLTTDPFLSGFTGDLTAARASLATATTASAVQSAEITLGNALTNLATVIGDDAQHTFTLSLSPDREIVQPNAPETFSIVIANKGTTATTYNLSVVGLPAGVSSSFSRSSITLQPGQSINAGNGAPILTLTESGTTLFATDFQVVVTAEGAPEITQATPGHLTLRDVSYVVATVTPTPGFTNAGGMVDVKALIQATVNVPTQLKAGYTVADSTGHVIFTSSLQSVSVGVATGAQTVDFGNLDTTAFADGVDTITVQLYDNSGTAIVGATGTGSLLIGQPVVGTLSTSPSTVPTGTVPVTTTLSITTQQTFTPPLSLLGAVSTPAPGTSVALFSSGGKTYAYESGTGGIDVIDVTDPTNPQFLEAFGQNDVTNGQFGFNIARVVNGILIVGTSNGNNGSVFNLLAYSLSNPASPSLISNTTINYRFLSDLLVNSTGTAAFVPTNGFFHFGSSIFQNFGDFVSIDLTDPTAPALAGSLFNNNGQPDGGDMNQFGGTLVNDQIAYSAGLSPGGGTVIGNHGNLLVINVADPKNMSLIRQLAIPNTINILDVANHGNRALVIGSAGTESSTYDPGAQGVANHLTLTLLDTTDPSNPIILGSTFVTNEQFPINEAGAKTDIVDLNDGNFAVSDTDTNGNPSLLVIDPTDPANFIVGATQVPSGVHGITVLGSNLYASTSSGLSIYHIDPLVSSPVTITANLPAGGAANIVANSFNIQPSQIITTANGDQLIWTRSFAAGNTTFAFTWQTNVVSTQPGQVTSVTTGATAEYTTSSGSGTLTLVGTSVTSASIVSITPAELTEQPGGSATYNVRLTNPTSSPITLFPTISGVPYNAVFAFTSVTIPANSSVDDSLTITSSPTSSLATMPFTVNVTSGFANGISGSASSSVTIAGDPVSQPQPQAAGVVVGVTPSATTVGQSSRVTFVVRLTNTGSDTDFDFLSVTGLPNSVTANFSQFGVNVPPGASNFREVTLTLFVNSGTAPGDINFNIVAASSNNSAVTASAQAKVTVTQLGVTTFLSQTSTQPKTTFQFSLYNTGTVTDTYDLSLGGVLAVASTLGTTQVTLAPGQSMNVPVTVSTPIDFALQGSLALVGIAKSHSNPAVGSTSTSTLTIDATTGMKTALAPASQFLAGPGKTSFLLSVQNTGNSIDTYEAVITGVAGPSSSGLENPNGTISQTIPLFVVPALSTGVVVIDTSLFDFGSGSFTVMVKSLQNPALVSSQTGTVATLAKTQTTLVLSTSSAVPGQAISLQAEVKTADGTGTPTGQVVFSINGQDQPAVEVIATGGKFVATLVLPLGLPTGTYAIVAKYQGSATLGGSASFPSPLVVTQAVSDGPQVVNLTRFGYHQSPTSLVIQFNQPIDPGTASNVNNYVLNVYRGARILVRSATYDPANNTVTLRFAKQLDLHKVYALRILGTGTNGVKSPTGLLLDGRDTGQPGSDAVLSVSAENLALTAPVPGGPRKLALYKRELAQIIKNQAAELNYFKHHLPTVAATPKSVAPKHAVKVVHKPAAKHSPKPAAAAHRPAK